MKCPPAPVKEGLVRTLPEMAAEGASVVLMEWTGLLDATGTEG